MRKFDQSGHPALVGLTEAEMEIDFLATTEQRQGQTGVETEQSP
jgi:hypothetical protein